MEILPVQTALWIPREKLMNILEDEKESDGELNKEHLPSETLFPVYAPVEKIEGIRERVDVYA